MGGDRGPNTAAEACVVKVFRSGEARDEFLGDLGFMGFLSLFPSSPSVCPFVLMSVCLCFFICMCAVCLFVSCLCVCVFRLSVYLPVLLSHLLFYLFVSLCLYVCFVCLSFSLYIFFFFCLSVPVYRFP